MGSVRGYFVCGEDHLARQRHRREEISNPIELLKAKHPIALLTVEDFTKIYEMDRSDDGDEKRNYDDDYMQWAQSEGKNVVFIASLEQSPLRSTL